MKNVKPVDTLLSKQVVLDEMDKSITTAKFHIADTMKELEKELVNLKKTFSKVLETKGSIPFKEWNCFVDRGHTIEEAANILSSNIGVLSYLTGLRDHFEKEK